MVPSSAPTRPSLSHIPLALYRVRLRALVLFAYENAPINPPRRTRIVHMTFIALDAQAAADVFGGCARGGGGDAVRCGWLSTRAGCAGEEGRRGDGGGDGGGRGRSRFEGPARFLGGGAMQQFARDTLGTPLSAYICYIIRL